VYTCLIAAASCCFVECLLSAACKTTLHMPTLAAAGNENTPALLQNIAVAIASATSAGKAEARRRRGAAAGGLAGDLWGQNPAVVLLADKPKEEMDAAVQEMIR
jgi:hypothetical protein